MATLPNGEARLFLSTKSPMRDSDGRVVAGIGGPDVALASAPGNDDGKWHHVALTRDSYAICSICAPPLK